VGDWKVRRVIFIAAYISNRTFSDDLTDEQQEELLAAQQELLGPRELRSNEAPMIDPLTKEHVGGAAIERSCRNADKNRSHTLGPSREKITKIVAPPASSKVRENGVEWDDNLKMRNNTLKASSIFYIPCDRTHAIHI